MRYQLKLEQLLPEMEYGTVTRWLKQQGERVSAGESMVEIEAEKANHEIESPVGGMIETLVAAEGDEIRVGDVLAVISV